MPLLMALDPHTGSMDNCILGGGGVGYQVANYYVIYKGNKKCNYKKLGITPVLTHPPLVKCLRPNRFSGVGPNPRKKVRLMDESKICPMLAIAGATDRNEDLPFCLQEQCAWWLPEYSGRMPIKVVGEPCAMSTLAYQVWNIAGK